MNLFMPFILFLTQEKKNLAGQSINFSNPWVSVAKMTQTHTLEEPKITLKAQMTNWVKLGRAYLSMIQNTKVG